ncbi:swr1 complex subunit 2 [Phtheirospermum japonicum]|uniref:Swr1 complex subunit 2 n=1 Tax=Phtheirospermum japonicum TaxID=374723 RepID=A0A830DKP1_9LAMI|nr:swr1 complex subunit 2 [Phtheirospermum japonicum]
MDTSKNEAPQHAFLDRASRATRGKRLKKMNSFGIKMLFKEEENEDAEYEEEGEAADVFDSDFDESEPEANEEAENEPNERTRTKKKLIYPGKQPAQKKKKTKLSPDDVPNDAEAEKSVRKSTRTSVIIRQAERMRYVPAFASYNEGIIK